VKVVVLGAGVIGVTSAYFLNRAGHEVTVIDRQPAAGLETSFANGGQISSGHAAPWASPDLPLMILKSLGKQDAPIVFRLKADPQMWSWGFKFLRNCTWPRYRRNTLTSFRISAFSRDTIKQVRGDTGIEYDHGSRGILHIFRDSEMFEMASRRLEDLKSIGDNEIVLDRSACLAMEPALETSKAPIVGGIHAIDDETGDALKFTQALATYCAERGVEFRYETTVTGFERRGHRIDGVITAGETFRGDAHLLCFASHIPTLTKQLGFGVPIYPVKGYSTTIPIGGANRTPVISVTDETRKIVVTRLGDRLRVAGTAEIAGYDQTLRQVRADAVLRVAMELYPEGGDYEKAEFWCGLRPVTPDGPPILGPTPYENLFINSGHGTQGWTMACGSGQVIADIISGEKPTISMDGLTLDRFH